ncbi:hypothetical protein A1O7_09984 [Cladophialophora yegresii CBS 114405]|uniref:Ubiquitin 3 binding protein But2 C-terminal domain-containing protein n=1 Tax=Cladophialophora yegresii CBS 114405 TaxID=1182544 RepID=W9VGN1_9EURO|nr:uncharacterized protein A1O7_09984 [Cladophialophora yegresii CBS 114405]EXJ54643.1 hypothetical protein A1O7_09984 [Cladophialophora yegresii CBS 114405]
MYANTIVLALLAATGTLAAPHSRRSYDNTVTVILCDGGETGAQVSGLSSTERAMGTPATSGPFTTIEISLGADVANKDLRCQALDNYGNAIVGVRGANVDTTFSDADKGAWTFRQAAYVSEVVCDPTFVKIDPNSDELSLRVILQSLSTDTGSQTVLPAGSSATSTPAGSFGPYETVELSVGSLVEKQDYRCKILDMAGAPLIVLRGENRDITFSDADKGAWTLETPSEVHSIVCDPSFVAQKL